MNCPWSSNVVEVTTTPGVSMISVWKLRPFSGRLSIACRSTTVLTVPSAMSTCEASASTVTDSETGPTSSRRFRSRLSSSLTVIPVRRTCLNRLASTSIR